MPQTQGYGMYSDYSGAHHPHHQVSLNGLDLENITEQPYLLGGIGLAVLSLFVKKKNKKTLLLGSAAALGTHFWKARESHQDVVETAIIQDQVEQVSNGLTQEEKMKMVFDSCP